MSDRLDHDSKGAIRAVSRAVAVLQAVNRSGSVSLSNIARSADIPHPTALRILRTLMDEGLIEQEPSRKRYRPTSQVLTLSCGFQNHDRLVSVARPHLIALTQAHGWPISIATRVGGAMIVRDSTSSLTSLTFNNYYPGWQVPLVTSASGKVYFAHADPEEQREVIRQFTYDDIDGQIDLLNELVLKEADKIVVSGYAVASRTQYSANPGKTSSIAVPLFAEGKLIASLAIVFFARAMPLSAAVDKFLASLQSTAGLIRQDLEASSPN